MTHSFIEAIFLWIKKNAFWVSILIAILLFFNSYYFFNLNYRIFVDPSNEQLPPFEHSLLVKKRNFYQIIYTLSFFFGSMILLYSVMSETLWRKK
jgi:hypothetical protein